ncbi:MAG: Txe/YoeB family addiction module toxin [Prolixibacteraceae bacterium]|jgi:toxin YoeB|nr:Txe/YoeB family addiction module toxin [Prolixibacteraceae bacterium]
MYKIKILPKADKEIQSYQKAGNKNAVRKIQKIVKELQVHPTTGTGQPEKLKYELTGYWSRRIDKKNRLTYRIEEDVITVVIVSALGHYI